jgi:hypothetical protein
MKIKLHLTSKLGIWFTKDKDYTEYFGQLRQIVAKLTYNKSLI